MISLFVVYLVFQSILSTKNDRYFITVLPFIAYFIACGVSWIYELIDKHVSPLEVKKRSVKLSSVISTILIVFLINSR